MDRDPVLFESTLGAASPLVEWAKLAFVEMQDFGRMASNPYVLLGDVSGYLSRRALPFFAIFSTLESQVGLQFANPVVHSYSSTGWPKTAPIGGGSDRLHPPRPLRDPAVPW